MRKRPLCVPKFNPYDLSQTWIVLLSPFNYFSPPTSEGCYTPSSSNHSVVIRLDYSDFMNEYFCITGL